MFTAQDMLALNYFNVLFNDESGSWELQSKNTEHCWRLDFDGYAYSMFHKHHIEDEYHYQTEVGCLYDVVLYIVSHDEYQLRGRIVISKEEEKRRGSLFWKLIDVYGLVA